MLLEHLIPHGFQIQLHSLPIGLSERALKELYFILSEEFRYNQFEMLAGAQGAILKEGDRRSCEMMPDRILVKEQPAHGTFEEYIEESIKIIHILENKLGYPVWVLQQHTLRFLIPYGQPVIPVINDQIFNLSSSAMERLGRPVLGLCLRVEIPPLPDDPTHYQLRVEPYFQDSSMIYLELLSRYLQPTPRGSDIRASFYLPYEFIKTKVFGFLQEALTSRKG